MRGAAALICALLAGCVSPSERATMVRTLHEGAVARVVPVSCKAHLVYFDDIGFPHPALGMTYRDDRKIPLGVDLSLVNAGEETMARNVSAHEFCHVLGLDHGTCPLCWMYGGGQREGKPLIERPSEDELAVAEDCPYLVVLVCDSSVPEPIGVAILWAVRAWNEALGERVFTVQR